jgi:hypothetical protein
MVQLVIQPRSLLSRDSYVDPVRFSTPGSKGSLNWYAPSNTVAFYARGFSSGGHVVTEK